MPERTYRLLRAGCHVVRHQCVRELVLDRERLRRPGGFVVAATHVSHLEPIVIALHTPRQIHWLARIEFFRHRAFARVLRGCDALCVDRTGVPAKSIRASVALAREGRIVGIFPEGGVVRGDRAMFRGAPFKRGACVIAIRARVPIVPVVVLGTEKLNRVRPWLPWKWARVWTAYGNPVEPPDPSMHRRAARFEMAGRLSEEFVNTYHRLLAASGLRDADVP